LYILFICLSVPAPTLHQHPPQDSTHLVAAPTFRSLSTTSTCHTV